MAAKYTIGQEVKQVVPVIQGAITERIIVGDDDVYKVSWTNEIGETIETYLKESELEAV